MLTKIPKIIFAVGLILSFISFQLITDQQKAQRAKEFKNHAQKAASLIKSKLDVNKEILLNIASLYSASDSVTRDEFKKFVTPIFERNDFIQALEWAPRVLHKNRDAFESRVQKEGYPNFHISDRIEQTTMVPAGVRSEYFPVMFAEPYEENKQVLGFDVASASTRLSTLSESRDSGQFLASPVIKLVHARGKEIGVLIFAPFYSGSEVSDTIEERRRNLKGFVLGVYRIETMLNSLVAPVTEP